MNGLLTIVITTFKHYLEEICSMNKILKWHMELKNKKRSFNNKKKKVKMKEIILNCNYNNKFKIWWSDYFNNFNIIFKERLS